MDYLHHTNQRYLFTRIYIIILTPDVHRDMIEDETNFFSLTKINTLTINLKEKKKNDNN